MRRRLAGKRLEVLRFRVDDELLLLLRLARGHQSDLRLHRSIRLDHLSDSSVVDYCGGIVWST